MKIETEADLDRLIEVHQTLLSGGAIVHIVADIPSAFAGTLQVRFLGAVVAYHLEHQKSEKHWDEVAAAFAALEPAQLGTHLEFFRLNYQFLSARNAGQTLEVLMPVAFHAVVAAQCLPKPASLQAQGFVFYNWARLLATPRAAAYIARNPRATRDFYVHAGRCRTAYYRQIAGGGDTAAVKAAATQVWKIRADWESFFRGQPVEQCGIDDALFAEVAALADPAFSAAKK